MIDLEKLLRVPYVDPDRGYDIAPDGSKLAFSWNKTGQWELYELPLPAPDSLASPLGIKPASVTGVRSLPTSDSPQRQETLESTIPGAKFAPKYSPDGSRLAYVVDFDGSENFHLFVHDFAADTDTDLTPDINCTLQPNFCWSPDGAEIALVANQSGKFDAYVMPSTGGPAKCVLSIQRPAWDVHWSPDGKWLAVTFESKGQDYGVYLVSMTSDESFPLADENGPLNAHHPSWSPDSTKLAFHSDAPNGWHQIGIFDLSSREITWLTNDKANCRTPIWSKDGSMLTYVRAQGALDEIVVHPVWKAVQLPSKQQARFSVERGVHYKPRFTPDGEHVIFIFNNPRFPPDLWKLTLTSGELQQLTDSLSPAFFNANYANKRMTRISEKTSAEFVPFAQFTLKNDSPSSPFILPEEITYPGMDGAPIPALLFKTDDTSEDTPAILVIHGGPNWHYQMEWYPFMIHIASRGWTVLAPNYRGSSGYGRDWQYANRFDLGGVDTDDVAAGAQFLIRERLADPAKIAVTGRSHGGYLVMTSLTQYPELWAAGSGIVPFINWFTCHARSRDDLKHWDIEMMGDPNHNYDLWYERSPYFFLNQIRVPVQLICGEHDPRCPAEESIETRDKLIKLGKQVDFRLYGGEGHSFLKIENVVDSEMRRVEFLAQVLEGQSVSYRDTPARPTAPGRAETQRN